MNKIEQMEKEILELRNRIEKLEELLHIKQEVENDTRAFFDPTPHYEPQTFEFKCKYGHLHADASLAKDCAGI